MQAGLVVLVALVLLPFGKTMVVSALLGGAIALMANLLMFLMVFRPYRAQQPEKILATFYSAEIAKLIFTMAAFALIVLNIAPLSFAALIVAYFVIQVIPALLINYR
jgi:ATP synthase protein I